MKRYSTSLNAMTNILTFKPIDMKRFIIIRIARLIRRKVHVAKNMQLKHIDYMYQYNYARLLKSYLKALML